MNGGGFTFWGLFVVFAAFVAAYVAWMLRVEREHDSEDPDES